MAEVLAEYPAPIEGDNGILYIARACGVEANNGLWQGWIEFVPFDGEGSVLRSPRETTQPNRVDTEYWATGLTPVYLEGALRRALNPLQVRPPAPKPEPVVRRAGPGLHRGARPASAGERPESVLRLPERRSAAPRSAQGALRMASVEHHRCLRPGARSQRPRSPVAGRARRAHRRTRQAPDRHPGGVAQPFRAATALTAADRGGSPADRARLHGDRGGSPGGPANPRADRGVRPGVAHPFGSPCDRAGPRGGRACFRGDRARLRADRASRAAARPRLRLPAPPEVSSTETLSLPS